MIYIHDRSLSCLGTGTSLKGGVVKLALSHILLNNAEFACVIKA